MSIHLLTFSLILFLPYFTLSITSLPSSNFPQSILQPPTPILPAYLHSATHYPQAQVNLAQVTQTTYINTDTNTDTTTTTTIPWYTSIRNAVSSFFDFPTLNIPPKAVVTTGSGTGQASSATTPGTTANSAVDEASIQAITDTECTSDWCVEPGRLVSRNVSYIIATACLSVILLIIREQKKPVLTLVLWSLNFYMFLFIKDYWVWMFMTLLNLFIVEWCIESDDKNYNEPQDEEELEDLLGEEELEKVMEEEDDDTDEGFEFNVMKKKVGVTTRESEDGQGNMGDTSEKEESDNEIGEVLNYNNLNVPENENEAGGNKNNIEQEIDQQKHPLAIMGSVEAEPVTPMFEIEAEEMNG